MKYLKKFNENINDPYYICCHSNINDILDEYIIYQYVQKIHLDYEGGFVDGDLGDRIEKYEKYKLLEIPIDKILLDEFEINDDKVLDYQDMINKNDTYPPIVLESEYFNKYTIIDGTHRSNALYNLGYKTIRSWVGIEK